MRLDRRVQLAAHPVALPMLRALPGPTARVPGLGVVVRDLDLVREAMVRSDEFRKNGPGTSSDLWTPVLGDRVLLNMSGDDHAQLRQRLAPLFAPRFVSTLAESSLRPMLDDLTARVRLGERVDVVEVANACASRVIGQLIGLAPGAVHADLYRQIHEISGAVTLRSLALRGERLERARTIMAEVTTHARSAWHEGDEGTVPGRMRSLGLSEHEALGAVGAFLLVGTETLTAYVPRLVALLADSGWLERVAADRDLVEPAIAEGLRVTTPVPAAFRHVPAATTLGSTRLREGDRVILLTFAGLQSGSFDPGSPAPASLKRMWFGAGSHFCLGAPLAMAQIRLVLAAVLDATEGAPLQVVDRRPARNVLIAAYRRLGIRR